MTLDSRPASSGTITPVETDHPHVSGLAYSIVLFSCHEGRTGQCPQLPYLLQRYPMAQYSRTGAYFSSSTRIGSTRCRTLRESFPSEALSPDTTISTSANADQTAKGIHPSPSRH